MNPKLRNISLGVAAVGAAGAGALLLRSRHAAAAAEELQTVPHVDVDRYMGKWFEIARFPFPFEKNCYGVTADYSLRPDGRVTVVNTCRKGSFDGPVKVSKGIARIADPITNAKLKVSFFWPFEGDYWVLSLGRDYEYAVVGAPDRKNLWILSRTPEMYEGTYNRLLDTIKEQGFNIDTLVRTPQKRG
jgi:apolipoprotein D and lipocalin family protein